jgi:V/A-type H+-transporting ATPase subunit F
MKMFLISDNLDTKIGMRLAGIEGVVVHEKDEVLDMLTKALKDIDIGIILITEKLADLVQNELYRMKLAYQTPLIIEIPDRHGSKKAVDAITHYVREAIGLKI